MANAILLILFLSNYRIKFTFKSLLTRELLLYNPKADVLIFKTTDTKNITTTAVKLWIYTRTTER